MITCFACCHCHSFNLAVLSWLLLCQVVIVRSKYSTIVDSLDRIRTCPFDATAFSSILQDLQNVVEELCQQDLAPPSWVAALNAKVPPLSTN